MKKNEKSLYVDLEKESYKINNCMGSIEKKPQWWTIHDLVYVFRDNGDFMDKKEYEKLCKELRKVYRLKYGKSIRIYKVFNLKKGD